MCGRFGQSMTWQEVWAFSQPLSLTLPGEPLTPRWNIAPSQSAWVLAPDGQGGAKAGLMRWGLVPAWAKALDTRVSTFNARIETAANKPTFRQSFQRRHCLVPASGWFEWTGQGRQKQPWYLHPADAPMVFFAGLWDRWIAADGAPLLSFTVLTAPAEGRLKILHDRRPVMVPPDKAGVWLKGSLPDVPEFLAVLPLPELAWHPVAADVGNVRAEGQQLIAEVPRLLDFDPRQASAAARRDR